MKTRLMFACVLAVAAAAFSDDPTAVQPAGTGSSSTLSFQSSGQSLQFQVRESKQFIRLAILDMQGRSVWSRVIAPTDGTTSISWAGTGLSGSRTANGVYAFQATTLASKGESVLMSRTFAYNP